MVCDECIAFPGCVNGDCTLANECNCNDGWHGAFCDIRESFPYFKLFKMLILSQNKPFYNSLHRHYKT